MSRKSTRIFGLYQGDQYIYSGTVWEISERTGLSVGNLKNLTKPSYKRTHTDQTSKYWMEEINDYGNT